MGIWINHAKAGTLVVRNEEWPELLNALTAKDAARNTVLRTLWGGQDVGAIVDDIPALADEQQVVSEYGELMTVRQVRARVGARRKDGMPTELFGYEEAPV